MKIIMLFTFALITTILTPSFCYSQMDEETEGSYTVGWNEYSEFYIDSISDKRYVITDQQLNVIDTAYAVAHDYDAMWFKMDRILLSDDYCEYYQFEGNWKYFGAEGHPMNGKIYHHPLSFDTHEFQILAGENQMILNATGDTLLESSEYLYEIRDGLYTSNISTGYYDPYKLIPNQQCDFLFDAKIRKSIKLDHPFHIGNNGNIVVAEEIGDEVLYQFLDEQDNYRPFGPKAPFTAWIESYNLLDIMEWDASVFNINDSISRRIKTLMTFQIHFGSSDEDWNLPYEEIEFIPYLYNEDNINYRCYGSPGGYIDIEADYLSDDIIALSIYKENYEITGGPMSTYYESFHLNFNWDDKGINYFELSEIVNKTEIFDDWLKDKWLASLKISELELEEFEVEDILSRFENITFENLDFIILESGIEFNHTEEDYSLTMYGDEYTFSLLLSYEDLESYLIKDFKKKYLNKRTMQLKSAI